MPDIEIEGLSLVEGIEKIQDCFLFRGLTYEETRMLAGICRAVEKNDGETIIEENSPAQGLYLVVDGSARVYRGEKMLAELRPGEMFGEMSLIEDMLTMARVTARGKTRLLHIDKRQLEELMEKSERFSSKVYRAFCLVLSERLRKANERLKEAAP